MYAVIASFITNRLHINLPVPRSRFSILAQSPIATVVAHTTAMLKRVIATAPRASRALSTSVRPALNSQARIAASPSIRAKRCYHEKDKLSLSCCVYLLGSHCGTRSLQSFSYPASTTTIRERSANTNPLLDHYSAPRNVGKMDKNAQDVGTGLVGAPACGDVMKLQIQVDPATNTISDVKFKTFGCGSAIASSSYLTELVRGMTLEDAGKVRNTEIARELCLPPVKRTFTRRHRKNH